MESEKDRVVVPVSEDQLAVARSLANVEIPDLSSYEFPWDYDAFEDENLNMLP